jgi:hypothetical protein
MCARLLVLVGLWVAATSAAGQDNGSVSPDGKIPVPQNPDPSTPNSTVQNQTQPSANTADTAAEYADAWSWVWWTVIAVGVTLVFGGVLAKWCVRARATGNYMADPWIRAKVEAEALADARARGEEPVVKAGR